MNLNPVDFRLETCIKMNLRHSYGQHIHCIEIELVNLTIQMLPTYL